MRRSAVLVDALLLAVAAIVACRPWSWRTDQVFAQGDTAYTLTAMTQIQRAFPGADMLDAPLSWPFPHGTTQSDWVLGQALVAMPLRWIGVDPLLQHNALVWLGLWTTAVALAATGAALGLDRPGRLLAGIVGGLGPLQVGHAQHVNLVWHAPVVAAAALVGIGVRRGDWRAAGAGGLVAAIAWQFGVYLGLQATVVAGVAGLAGLVGWAVPTPDRARSHGRGTGDHQPTGGGGIAGPGGVSGRAGTPADGSRPGRALVAGLAAFAAGMVPMVPVLWTYATTARAYGPPLSSGEVLAESWDLASTLRPWPSGASAGPVTLDWPNPGYVAAIAAIAGLVLVVRGRERAFVPVIAVIAAALLLALGPWVRIAGWTSPIPGPYWLVDAAVAGSLRAPARFLAVAAMGAGLLGGRGVQGRPILGVLAAILALLETRPAPTQPRTAADVEPAYLALDGLAPGPLFDTAVLGPRGCDARPRHALRAQSRHHRPLVGGTWARRLPAYEAFDRELEGWPGSGALAALDEAHAAAVLEHPPIRGADPAGWTCTRPEGHRLCVRPAAPWRGDAPESVRPVVRSGEAPKGPARGRR